jgi:hypothetical protein
MLTPVLATSLHTIKRRYTPADVPSEERLILEDLMERISPTAPPSAALQQASVGGNEESG